MLRRQATTNMNFQTTAERGRAGTPVDITVIYKNRRQVEDSGCDQLFVEKKVVQNVRQNEPHGNSTKASVPYHRTDQAILRESAQITNHHRQMPMTTSQQMMLNDSDKASNAKQIKDKVYRLTKTDIEKFPLHNIADEVFCVKKCAKTGNISTSEQTFKRYCVFR